MAGVPMSVDLLSKTSDFVSLYLSNAWHLSSKSSNAMKRYVLCV